MNSVTQGTLATRAAFAANHDQASEKYCVFQRGDSVYAILATAVREVGLRPKVARVPDSHGMLAGLGHLRNEFFPLLRDRDSDHGILVEDDHEAQVVVLSGDQGPWGMLVDRVIGLFPLDVSLCGEVQGAQGWSAAAMGAATLDRRVVRVLDERALYRAVADAFSRYWSCEPAEAAC